MTKALHQKSRKFVKKRVLSLFILSTMLSYNIPGSALAVPTGSHNYPPGFPHVTSQMVSEEENRLSSFLENDNSSFSEDSSYPEIGSVTRSNIFSPELKQWTVLNPRNKYEKKVFEMKSNGLAGRPIEYRNKIYNKIVHIRFLYDDENENVTLVDFSSRQFSTYRIQEDGKMGSLTALGRINAFHENTEFTKGLWVEIAMFSRQGQEIPVYIFHSGETGDDYLVRERKPDGPGGLGTIGRVLRYYGHEGFYDYQYEEDAHARLVAVTVINYGTGEFLKFEIPRESLIDSQARINKFAPKTLPQIKVVSGGGVYFIQQGEQSFFSALDKFCRQKGFVFFKRTHLGAFLLRGPPAKLRDISNSSQELLSEEGIPLIVSSIIFPRRLSHLRNKIDSNLYVFGLLGGVKA